MAPGGFPAVFWLFLEGLQEDALHPFGGVRAEGPTGEGGVLEDDLVGIGLAGVEAEIRIIVGPKIEECRAGAVDVGWLADFTEVTDVFREMNPIEPPMSP